MFREFGTEPCVCEFFLMLFGNPGLVETGKDKSALESEMEGAEFSSLFSVLLLQIRIAAQHRSLCFCTRVIVSLTSWWNVRHTGSNDLSPLWRPVVS